MSWVVVTSTFTQLGLEAQQGFGRAERDIVKIRNWKKNQATNGTAGSILTWSWWGPGLWGPEWATGRWGPPSPSSAGATPLSWGCPATLRTTNQTVSTVSRIVTSPNWRLLVLHDSWGWTHLSVVTVHFSTVLSHCCFVAVSAENKRKIPALMTTQC